MKVHKIWEALEQREDELAAQVQRGEPIRPEQLRVSLDENDLRSPLVKYWDDLRRKPPEGFIRYRQFKDYQERRVRRLKY